MKKKINKLIVLFLLTCSLILVSISTSQSALAEIEDKKQSVSKPPEVSYLAIAGSGFSSLLYTPIKFASALILGIGDSLSLMGTVPSGAEKSSIDIVKLGLSGDWWVSPDHLSGKRIIKFMEPSE